VQGDEYGFDWARFRRARPWHRDTIRQFNEALDLLPGADFEEIATLAVLLARDSRLTPAEALAAAAVWDFTPRSGRRQWQASSQDVRHPPPLLPYLTPDEAALFTTEPTP
jgi:hypothetical protein